MKTIKTKPSGRTPRTLPDSARAPKELARKSLLEAHEKAKESIEQPQHNESPTEYAETRVEHAADDIAYRSTQAVGERGRQLTEKVKETQKQHRYERGTENARSSFSSENIVYQSEEAPADSQPARVSRSVQKAQSLVQPAPQESNAYRTGRERVRSSFAHKRRSESVRRQSAQEAGKTARTPKAMAKRTVKMPKHSVKTAQDTVKTAQRTVKTAQQTARSAQKAAQAAAKAAQAAVRVAQETAKAAAAVAAKAAMKVLMAILKAIIAAGKALVAAIAAGGWVAAVVIIVVALITFILCSSFGVFFSNESEEGKPMTEAIVAINTDFQVSIREKIAELSASIDADFTEVIYEGDMESLDSVVPNWADVIGVYSVRTSMDESNPEDVLYVTPENIEKLEAIFKDMNIVTYRTETETVETPLTDEYGAIILDEHGNPVMQTTVTLYIFMNIVSLDYRDGAELYRFNRSQYEALAEMMLPEYYPLFAELLGDMVGNGGEYGLGLDINPDLPPSTLGAQIVAAAKKYIGRSYSSMDCAGLVRAAYRDCGLNSMNGLSSTGMAEKCRDMGVLFTDPSQLQAGDLIFFACKDASRGPGYCTDYARCGSGKCKRWMQIHHVAIYINETFLIDSTGGNNSVQIFRAN
ncbi:MAG TPA: NlpC/P60 family protein [Clostridia bacterium]|nr:NlpC/P60 family protein [Clostridia bacterium]HPK16737.1 NlpC/P60 family protein [Clostridia bacterium]